MQSNFFQKEEENKAHYQGEINKNKLPDPYKIQNKINPQTYTLRKREKELDKKIDLLKEEFEKYSASLSDPTASTFDTESAITQKR